MLKPNQKLKVKWGTRNKNYYQSKGYSFTKMGEEFWVNVEDIMPTSSIKVKCICDYCGSEFTRQNNTREQAIDNKFGELCYKCAHNVRMKEHNQIKYGVDIPSQTESAKQYNRIIGKQNYHKSNPKRQQTCLEKYGTRTYFGSQQFRDKIKETLKHQYGVSNVSQLQEVKDKKRATAYRHYGVDYPMQSPEVRQKIQDTMVELYGYKNASQVPQFKEKKRQTCQLNFGVDYPMQSQEVREKSIQTLIKTGNIPTSKPEQKLVKLLQDIYGYKSCKPSFPLGRLILDCNLTIYDIQIDIEYDGWYWHKNNQSYDRRRDWFVLTQNMKILRIKGNYQVPTKLQLQQIIGFLVCSQTKKQQIVMDI